MAMKMIGLEDISVRLWYFWLWIVQMWEFSLLLLFGFHPARKILSLTNKDSEEMQNIISTCITLYRTSSSTGVNISLIKDMLVQCDSVSLHQHTTDDGYNLLQLAVIKNDLDFAQYLLQSKKVNPNIAKCSPPLHIAIYNESTEMASLLLLYHARPQQQASMCHPEPHIPYHSCHSKFFFVSPSMICSGPSRDAYQRAIDRDCPALLEVLLRKRSSRNLVTILLHYACRVGAVYCTRRLCEVWRADVNATDNRGCTSLMHALSLDLDFINYLISQGADVTGRCYQAQTVMHKLLTESDIKPDIYDKISLFLALGADQLINETDIYRNTALHYLCARYSELSNSRLESELANCLGLLLKYNADTSIHDSQACLPLLRLVQGFCIDNSTECGSQDVEGKLLKIVHLFKKWAPAALCQPIDNTNQTVLFYLLDTALTHGDVKCLNCLTPAIQTGANVNHVAFSPEDSSNKHEKIHAENKRTLLTLVLRHALNKELPLAKDYSSLTDVPPNLLIVGDALSYLFKAGLDPDAKHIKCLTNTQSELVNALSGITSLLKNAHTNPQLQLIEQWLRIVLAWGGDPDREPCRAELQICTSQSGIFLKKETSLPIKHILQELCLNRNLSLQGCLQRIMNLFINSMSQEVLHQSLSHVHSSSMTNSSSSLYNSLCMEYFDSFFSQPLPLQIQARKKIFKTLKGHLAQNVHRLPIPILLKNNLLNIN